MNTCVNKMVVYSTCIQWHMCVHVYVVCVLCRLEEGGQTALGPALLLAVSMASRAPGSKVNTYMYMYIIYLISRPILFIFF